MYFSNNNNNTFRKSNICIFVTGVVCGGSGERGAIKLFDVYVIIHIILILFYVIYK